MPTEFRRPESSFRFGMGDMLLIVSAAAVIIAAIFAFPPVASAAIASLMALCIPAMLVGCLIYGSSSWRAFAVGALLPKVLRILNALFSESSLTMSGIPTTNAGAARYWQQVLASSGPRPMRLNPGEPNSAFGYFDQMAQLGDQIGQPFAAEVTLFWAASTVAGLATLFVQRRFARATRTTVGFGATTSPPR